MPELPEVEYAARIARQATAGRVITSVRVLHDAQRRHLPDEAAAQLAGERVEELVRRGKHQVFRLTSGRSLHVHFRMTGDWQVKARRGDSTRSRDIGKSSGSPSGGTHGHPRVIIELDDGKSLILDDPRALSVVSLCEAGVDPLAGLGPEATDAAFNAAWLRQAVAGRRAPIKVALLDQQVVAGIGNIYASESLWYARVPPQAPAQSLSTDRLRRVVRGVKAAMAKAMRDPSRYYGAGADDPRRFNVYDREGLPCRRCGAKIKRIVQAQRSTYYCPRC
jgi:formamidopyrimidine-DNA glycosylase